MESIYEDDSVTLYRGDCLDVMRAMPDESVDAIVTDPPYGLGFMGRAWDSLPPGEEWARECLRVLKPGGHLLSFGGTRTWHRLTCAVEDAGFDIRDSIAWLYGSGFPKSMNVSKAIASGGGRPEDIRRLQMGADYTPSNRGRVNYDNGGGSQMNGSPGPVPLTPEAEQWTGWGTALKPAFEPIVVARKPLSGTVAANVLEHGTGALNIDGCRVATDQPRPARVPAGRNGAVYGAGLEGGTKAPDTTAGRWPANVLLDESQAEVLDEQSGKLTSGSLVGSKRNTDGGNGLTHGHMAGVIGESYADTGGASRFFPTFRYQAKAPKSERPKVDGVAHPTVKPLALMRWLVRLVTPPGGIVLDPFAGSGTTVEACVIEGFRCIAIEKADEYLPLITQRIERNTLGRDTESTEDEANITRDDVDDFFDNNC